ncbi:MAG: ABC transporter substrate-binding protein [Solirubrobacteraceae bacterium]
MLRRLALLFSALALAGCGSAPTATLILDFTPNAVHAGIYSAVARGFVHRLAVREPSSSTDAVKLLLSGRADFAVLDIHDLALARAAGKDVVGVFPLVQRPLAAVLAQPGIRTPAALAGRTAGVTGLPSDVAVLHSILGRTKVREVTIGFDAVPALLGGRVAAATAFWDVEGIALARRRPGIREFRVDDYGAPAYPELVLSVSGRMLRAHAARVHDVVTGLRRGYAFTRAQPAQSAADELRRAPGLNRGLLLAELAALGPAFGDGRFDYARLDAWAAWEQRFGIVKRAPDVHAMFR